MIKFIQGLKKESVELGIPLWKMPDMVLILMGAVNIATMLFTYFWAEKLVRDPREAVLLVAVESALIMIIGNGVVESSKKVVEVNRLQKEFLAIISHQIRTPLTMINWNLGSLLKNEEKNLSKKQVNYITQSQEKCEFIGSMVGDILNASRLEAENDFRQLVKVDLVMTIEDCLLKLKEYSETKKIKIKFEKEKGKEFIIMTDEGKLKIALNNLIENAISYGKEGGKVEIDLKSDEDSTFVSIADDGIGIDVKDRPFIFKKFFRGDEARKSRPQGTGLGLFITKNMLEGVKAKIKLDFAVSEGTKFDIEIPNNQLPKEII